MDIENYIETQYRELYNEMNIEYLELYKSFSYKQLDKIFSTIHFMFANLYKIMNEKLPTGESTAHFCAEPSRRLIQAIEILRGLQRVLKNTSYAFEIEPYYENIISISEEFLKSRDGSEIPPHMGKVEIYYTKPILRNINLIKIPMKEDQYTQLKQIGEGSYAQVFSYKDTFYNRKFVLKRAKKELSEKELERFSQEYEQMKTLHSPYIVDVYCFNKQKNQYVMEFMDFTLDKYYEKNNSTLSVKERKNIANQVLRSFKYIHSKNLLHRDISPKNILLKVYDDVKVVKVSDFGLVKVPDSSLTSVNTEFKGYFNDPGLITSGFSNYNIVHETYALTRLIYYIMTGKKNIDRIEDSKLKSFVEKGLSTNHSIRYKSIDEMINVVKYF